MIVVDPTNGLVLIVPDNPSCGVFVTGSDAEAVDIDSRRDPMTRTRTSEARRHP
jgi:hypothetical protein